MTGPDHHFAADWLSLREPADAVARCGALVDRLNAVLDRGEQPSATLDVIDLGCGHGSNLRYLAPRLKGKQHWLLIDQDPELLERAAESLELESLDGQPIRITTLQGDLSGLDLSRLETPDLVTASALFDLTSRAWIEALVEQCRRWRAAVLFALTVDGRRHFTQVDGTRIESVVDERMREWFNQHQRRSKGLGEALGPQAVGVLEDVLERNGFCVDARPSRWNLSSTESATLALGRVELDGWQQAALDIAPDEAEAIGRWHRQRQADLEAGQAGLMVGHVDLLGLPPGHDAT